MQLQSHLVHAEADCRVVLVGAWQQGICLGSALGEGSSAEEAEDRAIERLRRRLLPTSAVPVRLPPAEPIEHPPQPSPPGPDPAEASPVPEAAAPSPELASPEPPADPEDWSDELAEVELELRRLHWGREQEAIYLERVFGHPSRSRLVRYPDLISYRKALRQLEPGSDPALAPPPLRRHELITQCEQLLDQLHWGAAQGREFLERHFALSSRQLLSDEQLLHFNMLLEGVLIGEHPVG
ncbi:hypothetical protein KBY66_03070 [Synechococcus sp. Tobar12-5m-g]|uniref:hypothetical protein n=1 Tax=unclassified Synechococcus TaxID=2626047 RepID=UPI0020CEE327|nr:MULTISPECIES: hypothetical protein [unclassified Synechococcus]MCP9771614.1 hypothetical protein [Synechococcus sp. Tobar12-5m-g]MCP9872554.1 hypothetical protein [Synechococcus sp. Cruz CV-v-12]